MELVMSKTALKTDMVGREYDTKFGKCEIIHYRNSTKVTVRFKETAYETTVKLRDLERGKVRDRLLPSVYGIGVVGNKYKTGDENKKIYSLWCDMLRRCFSDTYKLKYKTYKDCTCSENFKRYEYFYEWCNKQVGYDVGGFDIDKDLLIRENKVYSENTCVFLPKEINTVLIKHKCRRGKYLIGVYLDKDSNMFTSSINLGNSRRGIHLGLFVTEIEAFNAYKTAKENYLKELAEKWKSKIDERAYNALMKYEVTVND